MYKVTKYSLYSTPHLVTSRTLRTTPIDLCFTKLPLEQIADKWRHLFEVYFRCTQLYSRCLFHFRFSLQSRRPEKKRYSLSSRHNAGGLAIRSDINQCMRSLWSLAQRSSVYIARLLKREIHVMYLWACSPWSVIFVFTSPSSRTIIMLQGH